MTPAAAPEEQGAPRPTLPSRAPLVQRLLKPSLSDLFFAFFTTWIFLANPHGATYVLQDSDTALHTRIGQYILETGTVPRVDLFSFSKPGEPWYAFEWLAETAYAGMFNWMGLKGVVLLGGMLIALYTTVLLKYMLWKGANGLVAMVVMMLAVNAASIHYLARPHLFTLLFLSIAVWIFEYQRRHESRLIWILVPLMAIWVNTHGGFLMFFALLALRAVGCLAEGHFWPETAIERRREARQLGAVGAACALISLANPYGIHLHLHAIEILRSAWIRSNVSEFLAPSFRSEPEYEFMVLLFAGLACLNSLIRKKSIVEPLWIAFLGYCSLTSVRHAPIYVLIAAPLIASELSDWWAWWTSNRPERSVLGILSDVSHAFSARLVGTSLFVPAVMIAFAVAPGIPWPKSFPSVNVPVRFIEKHADLLANARVLTTDQAGGYLVFRNQPRQKVFIDGRNNYYGEEICNDYINLTNGGANWRKLLDKYRFDTILASTAAPISSLVQAAGGWRVVDTDGKQILFQRENPE